MKRMNMPFILLVMASLFSTALLILRLELMGIEGMPVFSWDDPNYVQIPRGSMLFLIWNLFLAWIPYCCALLIAPLHEKLNAKWVTSVLFFLWILFLPNAPYIITDFVHLKKDIGLPFWYDILVLSFFSGIGLLLGLLSMLKMEEFISRFIHPILSQIFIVSTIPLIGFGIWIGRYQRWNSWDIFTRPHMLLMDVYSQIKDPISNMDTLGLSLVITVLVLFSYLFIQSIYSRADNQLG